MSEDSPSGGARAGRRWLVSGRVQGVGFRASARREALALGLCGHARNLPDGRVEVVASGAPDAMASFRAWLEEGPRPARVARVDEAGAGHVTGSSFEVR